MKPETNQTTPPPATALERQNAVEDAIKAGDFDARIQKATEAKDRNLVEVLDHARAVQGYTRALERAGEIKGKIIARQELLKVAKGDKADAIKAELDALSEQAKEAQQAANKLASRATDTPMIVQRGQNEDVSDCASMRVMVKVQDGPYVKHAPITGFDFRGLKATLNAMAERGLDFAGQEVVIESSQGWRYLVAINEMGQAVPRLLRPDGSTARLIATEDDGRGPAIEEGGQIYASAQDFYGGRPFPVADFRTKDERYFDNLAKMMGDKADTPDAFALLKRALVNDGVKIVRRQ